MPEAATAVKEPRRVNLHHSYTKDQSKARTSAVKTNGKLKQQIAAAPQTHRRVILETPFAAPTVEAIAANIEFARRCLRDCLLRGESPIASHLLYTQDGVLQDTIPEERKLGIEAGLAWSSVSDASVVYIDRGISKGMRYGIERALASGNPVEFRVLDHSHFGSSSVTDMLAAIDGK